MKIDLHTHTDIGSTCGKQGVEELIDGAIKTGMDAICLTDHNNLFAERTASERAIQRDFLIFMCMEVTTEEGDMLVFSEDLPEDGYGKPEYAVFREMIDLGSVAIIPAHPYRNGSAWKKSVDIIKEFPDDFAAIEAYSFNMTAGDSRNAVKLARDTGIPIVANSDSHACQTPAGSNYNLFDSKIKTIPELVSALNAGAFKAVAARTPETIFSTT